MRCFKTPAHPNVLDSRLLERIGLDGEARTRVERDGLQLRGQAHPRAASLACGGKRELEHPQRDAAPAPLALYRNTTDFRTIPVEHHAQRADHPPAVAVERHEVQRIGIMRVDVLLARDALLAVEHPLSERERPP